MIASSDLYAAIVVSNVLAFVLVVHDVTEVLT